MPTGVAIPGFSVRLFSQKPIEIIMKRMDTGKRQLKRDNFHIENIFFLHCHVGIREGNGTTSENLELKAFPRVK